MSRDVEFRSKSKRVHKMTRDGLVEINKETGEETLVSQMGDEKQNDPRDYSGEQRRDANKRPDEKDDGHGRNRQSVFRDKSHVNNITENSTHSENRDHRPQVNDNHVSFITDDENQQQHIPGGQSETADRKARSRKSMRRKFDAEQQADGFAANEQNSIYSTIHDEHDGDDSAKGDNPTQDENTEETDNDVSGNNRLRQDNDRPQDKSSNRPKQHKTKYSQKFSSRVEQQHDSPRGADSPEAGDEPGSKDSDHKQQDSSNDNRKYSAGDRKGFSKKHASRKKKQSASKLKFSKDEKQPEPDEKPPTGNKKLDKAKKKAGKTDRKLEKAEGKLPTHKRLRFNKEFDVEAEKPKRHLRIEREVKSQRAHLKGPVLSRPPKVLAQKTLREVHKKVSEVEHENVGVEAAHTGEKILEKGIRGAYRSVKLHPYHKVNKLKRRSAKWSAKSTYQQALHDNPQLSRSAVDRFKQKRAIKKQYAKEARKAKKAAARAGESRNVVKRTAQRASSFVRRHPVLIKFMAILLFLVLIASGLVSTCSNMGESSLGAVLGSSYLATDHDIDDAELYYTEWEADLLLRAQNAENEFPGYDEYVYQIDEMGHNPFELMGFLTAVYQDFTYSEIQGVLYGIFEEQYQLEFVPVTETRYRDVTYSDEHGGTYTKQEAYEWRILNVILTTNSFSEIVANHMDADAREIFDVLMSTKGNRQYLYNIFEFNWLPYVAEFYGYSVANGAKVFHNGVDIVAPVGSNILAGYDGNISSSGGTIVLEGEEGLVTRYVGCSGAVGTGQVKAGDVIAQVGSGGSCWGLHLEVIKDGRNLNPIYFAETGDDGSSTVPPGQPQGPEIPSNPDSPLGDGSYAALIAEAEKYLGYPYVWGGSNPKQSFDCSGYVCWVLNKSGVKNVGRTTAQGIYGYCTPVSRAEARPGDIIFFQGTYKPGDGRIITHVGIYVGNGMMIHCAGNGVEYHSIDSPYYQKHLYAFGRLKN